jgi:hypothetical protein
MMVNPPIVSVTATDIASICYHRYVIVYTKQQNSGAHCQLWRLDGRGACNTLRRRTSLCHYRAAFTLWKLLRRRNNPHYRVCRAHGTVIIDRAFETVKLKHGTERRVCTVLRLRRPRKSCTMPGARRRPNCVSDSSNVMIATRYNIFVALRAI